jgi:hypothetical protein
MSELLEGIAGKENQAVNFIGSTLGALADLGGGIEAVVGLVGIFLADDNTMLGNLEEIETEIQQGFAGVHAEQRVQNILNRWNNLDPAVAQAQAVLDNLPAALSQVPPVDEGFRLQQIQYCLDSVEQFTVLPLNQDPHWLSVFDDEIYYGANQTDLWTGVVAPAANPDGTVFSDRYILAYYMRVLYDFMLTAAAFVPDYQTRYKEPLQRFAARLQEVYDTSRLGIVVIRTPNANEVGISGAGYTVYNFFGTEYLESPIGESQWHSPFIDVGAFLGWTINGQPSPQTKQSLDAEYLREMDDAYFQEYGVVHTYSGFSRISHYPPIVKPAVEPSVFLTQFNATLNLAIRRNWKEAYAGIGLPAVWATINTLRRLTGDAASVGFDPNVAWSLREISQILGPAFRDPAAPVPRAISAADVLSRLAIAGGISTQRPLSWRAVLTAALSAATVNGVINLRVI